MNWQNLLQTASQMGENQLPDTLTDELLENEEFLAKMHNIIF